MTPKMISCEPPVRYKSSTLHTRIRLWFIIIVVILILNIGFLHEFVTDKELLHVEEEVARRMAEAQDAGNNYNPVYCPSILEQKNKTTLNDPNEGVLHARETATTHKFWISLHNSKFDPARWVVMERGYYYEKAMAKLFDRILLDCSSQPCRVLDVGANIGYYSLYSASLGNHITVDAFEPNLVNVLRFCESLDLNHWYNGGGGEYGSLMSTTKEEQQHQHPYSSVNLYNLGVGNETGHFAFQENINPGAGKFTGQMLKPSEGGFPVITLDELASDRGWLFSSSSTDIAILKIDVEGFEWNVVEGAKRLLEANLVRNIFMETSSRTLEEANNILKSKILIDAGYKLVRVGGYGGPDTKFEWFDKKNLPRRLRLETLRTNAKQLNLWWTLRTTNISSILSQEN